MITGYYGLRLGSEIPIKRKVFVSYHHDGDQYFYNQFSGLFADTFDVFHDKSLDRAYNSDNTDYVRWQIRQNDITGSSCTIVLCGAQTHKRKYVDWEIKATLDTQHGLIGIRLPTLPLSPNGGTVKPERLQENIDSEYAKWLTWEQLDVGLLTSTIEAALVSPGYLIRNQLPLRIRNG
jgi:MTH538 TIR-like domain (DUF1863)